MIVSCSLILLFRYGRKREAIKPVIPRGTPSGVGAEQYSPGMSNGSAEGPPLTEGGGQSTNCNGTSRSSPLCVPTQGGRNMVDIFFLCTFPFTVPHGNSARK